MKLCYCDETGTGEEPFAVLLGVIVDSSRMHVTKGDWADFLAQLSKKVNHDFHEFHTRNFYAGSGFWKRLSGQMRSDVIDFFLEWFAERKHRVVFSAIDKARHEEMKEAGNLPDGVDSVWKAMGFHVALAMQKAFQGQLKNKGNTIFIFDEEVKEETKFQKLLLSPPDWSDSYYSRKRKKPPLCQVVDAPYFADSKNVGLLQVADFLAYFVRRYIELSEGAGAEKYRGEQEKIERWYGQIKHRAVPFANMYPKTGRCEASDFFWDLAPECIRR